MSGNALLIILFLALGGTRASDIVIKVCCLAFGYRRVVHRCKALTHCSLQGGFVVNSDGERQSDVHIRDGLIHSLANEIKVRPLTVPSNLSSQALCLIDCRQPPTKRCVCT